MAEQNDKSRVQVAVRIRPVGKYDKPNERVVTQQQGDCGVSVDCGGRSERTFAFDNVFGGGQDAVFEAIGRPMLTEAYKGFNVCLLAYGQTGSGKTYSLLGDFDDEEKQGVAPRFVRSLFDEAQRLVEEDTDLTIKITLSMVEVYMERVRDLLAPRQRGQEPESLEIHENSNRRVYVKDAGVHPVLSFERMMELLRKGNANRQTGETKMNETSSRSHAIMQIGISQEFQSIEKKDLECTVSLVDLAGSERQAKTESTGQHFEEAKKINHSLLMLGRALNSFSERKSTESFISLRESKLTRLLSESFGGNSKTWMLATVSPTAYNLTETISTLEYASNAMAITNKAKINNTHNSLELKDLKSLVTHLERRLEQLAVVKDQKEVGVAELTDELNALQLAVQGARAQEATRLRLKSTLNVLRLGNIALRRRVEAASQRLIWPLDNKASYLFFKGRAGVTLERVFLGKQTAMTVELHSDSGTPTEAVIFLKLFSMSPNAIARSDPMELIGSNLQFCLCVDGARGIPQSFATHVFCIISLRHDQERRQFMTTTSENKTDPCWDFVKQFELPDLTAEVIHALCTEHLFTFEVFGFGT